MFCPYDASLLLLISTMVPNGSKTGESDILPFIVTNSFDKIESESEERYPGPEKQRLYP